jgi:hypothetical protein
MPRIIAIALLWPLIATTAFADDPPPKPCASSVHRQFDFWVGQWNVTEAGQPAGYNDIQLILNGCGLLENWTGTQGGIGKSLNYYNAIDGLWHQQWVDGSGGSLSLAGKFENGAMRLEGLRPATAKQPAMRHRITWTALPGGKVRQLWESAPADKDEWSKQFDGIYERVAAAK